jgi:uncharacterized protein YjdB
MITYTAPTSCMVAASVAINASAITGSTYVCLGATSVLTGTTPGGLWTSSNTAVATVNCNLGIVTGVSAGTAVITYSFGSGCSTSATVTVISLTANTGLAGVCVGSTTSLNNATAGGAWTSSNTAVATVGSTGIVSGVSAGNATITYSFGNSCYSATGITALFLGANTGTASVCPGLATALSNVTVGGTWSSGSTAVAAVGTSGIVTGVSAGTAAITYTFGTGCTSATVVTVNPAPAPVSVTGGGTFCGSAMLYASGGSGATLYFEGTNPAGTSALTPADSQAVSATGTYYFAAQSAAGCWSAEGSAAVTIPVITGVNTICQGTTATLGVTGGAGTWTSGNAAVATVGASTGVVTGVSTGTALITNTLSTGCVVTGTVTISPAAPAISGPASVCVGQTIALADNGTGGTWSSSAPTIATVGSAGIVTGVASGAGLATITYTLGSACKATATVSVTSLTSTTGSGSVCVGQTTTLTNSTSGGTWTSSATGTASVGSSGIVTGVTAGSALISYALPSGCVATSSVSVIVLSGITGPASVCVGQTMTLADATGGGTWSTGAPTIATIGSSNGVVTGVAGGLSANLTYTLGSGCKATVTVTVNSLAAIGGPGSVCQGQTITLTNSVSGGAWSSAATGIASVNASTGVLAGVGSGIVTISYVMPTGCTTTTPVFVNPVAAITGPSTVCLGQAMTLTDAAGAGTWSTSAPTIATVGANTGIVTGVAANLAANITYTFCSGCKVWTTVTVNPLAVVSGPATLCQGQTASLTDGTAGGSWASSNSATATVGTSGIVTGVGAGPVVISYILPTGCTAVQTETVNPLAAIAGPNTVCVGKTIALSDLAPGGTWYSPSPTIASISASGIVTGVAYGLSTTLSYTLSTGCRATLLMSVVALPTAPATIGGPSSVSVSGSPITLTDATGGGTWSSSNVAKATVVSGTGVVTGVSSGSVTITYTVTNGGGCTAYVTKNITVGPTPPVHITTTSAFLNLNIGASSILAIPMPGGIWTCSECDGIIGLDTATGQVTGLAPGRATITYTITEPTGTTTVLNTVIVSALTETTSSLTAANKSGDILLLPNPNTGGFTIKGSLATTDDADVTLEVMDMLGQVIYKGSATARNGKLNEHIQLESTIANGMYILSLKAQGETSVFHFVVER